MALGGGSLSAAEARNCGLGLAGRCCIFLTMGATGFLCGRYHSVLRTEILGRKESMSAQYEPAEGIDFPDCQPDLSEVGP